MSDSEPDLAAIFPSPSSVEQVRRYVEVLTSAGVERGLLGPSEAERIWRRHILNSVAVVQLIPSGARVIDVGSGAGLPGIPVALARPDLHVTLLEPLLRRSTFLTEVVEGLGLSNRVRVVRERAEQHTGAYDVVLARALAPLDRLLLWCDRLVRPNGVLLAFKGRSAGEEVRQAGPRLQSLNRRAEVLQVQATADSEPTHVVRVR